MLKTFLKKAFLLDHEVEKLYKCKKSFSTFSRFKKKLKELEQFFKVREIPLTNMLSFVIMAENFNKNSNYIKRVISEALEDMGSFGKQEKLLIYLAIMRYFGDTGLPSSHCHFFIDNLGAANIKNTLTLMDTLCSQAKLFVVERTTEFSIKVLEISHEPVAFQLLEKYTQIGSGSRRAKLSDEVMALLREKKIMGKRFASEFVHSSLRKILSKV